MNRLPRSVDDLRGLRAARWIRESTRGQQDRYGPAAQRDQQDRAIERYGLVDTGVEWSVAHSGRTIGSTPAFAEMLEGAGATYDVLLVGYVSRFARDLETAVPARKRMHAAGAALLFCDERVLSSDEDAWETWARETVEAEAYSRRLARRIREGYDAKFRRHADQAGSPPFGFRREPPALTLAVDEATIARAVAAFERYAGGTVSLRELGDETGIDPDALRSLLANPIYNGWMRRHRRRHDEQRLPAPWRDDPPVSDELWARVQEVRDQRYHGGGRPTPVHTHLLNGRVFCGRCGARIRAEPRRYRHFEPCDAWPKHTRAARLIEEPIARQIEGVRHGAAMLATLRRLAESGTPRPDSTSLRRRQLERELAGLASRHARRVLSTAAYLAEHERITGALDSLSAAAREPSVDPDEAIAYLRDLPRLWRETSDEGRQAIARATYERVLVTSDGIAGVELTADAIRHGMMDALPEKVLLARPAGAKHDPTAYSVSLPIIGKRAWIRAVKTA